MRRIWAHEIVSVPFLGVGVADEIVIRAPDDAERIAAVRVFLRSFRQESESSERWLDHFTRMLVDAGIARLTVALEGARGDASAEESGDTPAGLGGKVIGCGALICFVETAWIALMAVEPGLQRRGTGSLIMGTLMKSARNLGYRTVKLDATNFGRGLYARHGFVDEYPAKVYEIPARCDLGEESGPKVRLDEALAGWCLLLDREAIGDDRSVLLNAALADGAKVLMVEEEGFGVLHGRKVGPVIARNTDAAIAIVRRAGSFGANRIYVPHHPGFPSGFLVGLKEVPPRWELECCTRMIYGEPVKRNASLEYAGYSAATG
jgi:GNAT superfamily N-acetyltransferase